MNPAPHRISLASGWKYAQKRWERIFHTHTLPATVTSVRLIVSPPPAPGSQIQLNGSELTWRVADSQLDCDITDRLRGTNKLIIDAGGSSPLDILPLNIPPFEAFLEIFDNS